MRPLRIKASGSPITSANFQGLQELTDPEIQQYVSYVITNKFASDTDGTGTAELNVNEASGTSIGVFTDTVRDDAIGTHPTDGATSSTTYTFKQVTSAAAESITNRPVGWDSAVKEFTDGQLDTDLLDTVIDDMVSESNYTVGQYKLGSSAPAGGTWTSRYTITDTALGGNTTYYLWQKTAPTSSANSDLTSLKLDGTNVKQMTAAEIEQQVPNFRNRIVGNGVGTYLLDSATPAAAGTWTQMGDAISDTRQVVSGTGYAGTYNQAFTGAFNTTYTGPYVGNYSGTYTGAKNYTGSYTKAYSGNYSGAFVGTSAYAGAYSQNFAGTYSRAYAGPIYYAGYGSGSTNYTKAYTGTYVGYFTGYYTGAKSYTGTYTGEFNQAYTGVFVGTSTYTGNFAGTYTGSYTKAYSGAYTGQFTGNYTGDTVQASKETVSTMKLWLRTA